MAAVSACADESRTDPSGDVGPQGGSTSNADGSTSDSTGDVQPAETAADTAPPKLDVGGGSGSGGGDSLIGCKKVDIVFVIDGSGSMADEQQNLLAAFPNFIDTMRTELNSAEGFNVGVVRTDGNDISCVPGRYGVLVTRNYALGSSNATCTPYASGQRHMTQDDDLPSKFNCAARVGTGGDGDEQPMQAVIAALTPPNTDVGECNEGFLRDDALLVIVIITDEEDDHETMEQACGNVPSMGSPGEPADWYDAIVAAKGGVETNVVILSLVGTAAPEACPPLDKCDNGVDGAEIATRLLGFTWMFTHGHVGPVCGDYDPFFQEAVADIKDACEEFVPPG